MIGALFSFMNKICSNKRVTTSFKAFAVHFALSCCVAFLIAALVFFFWFPFPYGKLVGAAQLFFLIIAVDLVCGPLLTGIVFNSKKSKRELKFDVSIIVLLQIAALAYCMTVLWQSRPIYLVFEVDRLKVVTYADIRREDLNPALNELHRIPWSGVRLIGARESVGAEVLDSLDMSFQGYDPSARPNWWVEYSTMVETVKSRAHPISELIAKRPSQEKLIREELRKINCSEEDLLWLPLTSYKTLDWVVLIDKVNMRPVSYIHVDGF